MISHMEGLHTGPSAVPGKEAQGSEGHVKSPYKRNMHWDACMHWVPA